MTVTYTATLAAVEEPEPGRIPIPLRPERKAGR